MTLTGSNRYTAGYYNYGVFVPINVTEINFTLCAFDNLDFYEDTKDGSTLHATSHNIWDVTWYFQQCGMCDQQSLIPACAYAQSDQSLCLSLEYSMGGKLLTEHHLRFLSLKGGCTGSSESALVKMPHCRKSHVAAHISISRVWPWWRTQMYYAKEDKVIKITTSVCRRIIGFRVKYKSGGQEDS